MSLHQLGAGQCESAQALAGESVARLAQLFADLNQENRLKNSVQATTLYRAIALARMIRLTIAHSTTLSNGLDGFSIIFASKEPAETAARVEQLLRSTGHITIALSDAPYQRPAIAFPLTEWIYSCVSRSQISVDGTLPAHVKDTYRACLDWYQSTLNQGGGMEDAGPFIQPVVPSCHNVTYILFVYANRSSMYHHFCLLTLFRSFYLAHSEEIAPVQICRESADSILSFTQMCCQLENFHLPCFVPLFVFAAGMADEKVLLTSQGHFVDSGRTCSQFARSRGDNFTSQGTTGGSSGTMLGDYGTARRSLADRALEQLAQLSDTYPSARKAAFDLESAMSRRGSISPIKD